MATSIAERLDTAGRRVAQAQGVQAERRRALQTATSDAESAESAVTALDAGLGALHVIRDATSARVQAKLADLTSEGLRIVFDDPDVRLEVRNVERRGVIETDLILVRGELETDPLSGNGGGLVADASAMLRLVLVRLLSQRGLAPLLILDEPFAALSQAHREAMADTLEEVAGSLGIQVIMTTHADEFARGTKYRVQWADRAAVRAEVVLEVA